MIDLEDIIEDDELDDEVEEEEVVISPRRQRSACPESDDGHKAVPNNKRSPYDPDYRCEHCGKTNWTRSEMEELIANVLLREDSNRELCRTCRDADPDSLPYGEETGHIEWQMQTDENGTPLLDDEDNVLYVGFPELHCDQGHRWYKGEGPRRDIRGKNPILFETHLYNRKRREIHVKDGIPDPAFTMDRWGKRPTTGLYIRTHPQGRKQNTDEQRKKKNGASFYR